jgi:phage terminase large subunit
MLSNIIVNIPKKAFLPCYHHLLNSDAHIDFYWGGRDSGKSQDIAQQLIKDCLSLPYFKCLLIKKTHNTIQESQWETIKNICEAWGIDHLFKFRVAPLSIECINGNRFLARGCDNPQSIKSTRNPSHSWIEEANQLNLDDFITVTTTLRSNEVRIKQRVSFNPEFDGDYEEHWLWKTFFAGKDYNGSYAWVLQLPSGKKFSYTYTSTHTTYLHNPKVSPERIAFLEMLKDIDPYYYQVFTKGLPGRRKNNAPFAFAFDRVKHLGPTTWLAGYETMVSFDFNKSPICASVWQFYNNELFGIEAVKLDNSDIYKLCDYLLANYPGALWLVTGDATGQNTTALIEDNLNYYKVIKSKMDIGGGQLKVPSVNPRQKENQVLVNAVLALMKVTIDPLRCKALIFDLENVRVLADGTIEKRNREDPTQQSDLLDTVRYLCNTFFSWVLKQ